MAVSDCCKYSEKLPVAQGRRPPSSDVDAIEAENFESGGALKEISNPENLMLSEELRQIVFRTIESLGRFTHGNNLAGAGWPEL